jgi:dolichol-phosphate mannosyltransferase
MEVSVVIPVFNESENLASLITEVNEVLKHTCYELIIVDDASTDSSPRILETLKTQEPNLRVIRHQDNRGQSAAVITGVRAAKYPWVATLDGDRQNDPRDLITMIELINQDESVGLVMGRRTKREDNYLRKISTKIANSIRRFFLKDDCYDSGCGIKIFSRSIFLQLPLFRNCHRFLPALFKHAGCKILYVPVHHRPRVAGVSKYGVWNRLWVGIVDLFGIAWLLRRILRPVG